MPNPLLPHERLAQLMDQKRLLLGFQWTEVAGRGGVSTQTLRQARSGENIAPLTKRAIEVGLDWPPGAVDRIIEDVDYEPDSPPPREKIAPPDLRWHQIRTDLAHAHRTDVTVDEFLDMLATRVMWLTPAQRATVLLMVDTMVEGNLQTTQSVDPELQLLAADEQREVPVGILMRRQQDSVGEEPQVEP